MDESQAIVERIYTRAAERLGGSSALARHLGIAYSEVRTYLTGQAMPPEAILLRTVDLLLDELPALRRDFSPAAWEALRLPL